MFDNGAIKTEAMLCFNLYAASLAMTRFYKPFLEPLGLTYPQYLVLLSLNQEDRQGVSKLSDELQLDTGTLSPLLKRMEASQFIKRHRQADDERRVLVELTELGREVAAKAARIPQCIAQSLGPNFEEIEPSRLLLAKLRKVLAKTVPPVLAK